MTLLPRSLEFKSTWLDVNTDFLRPFLRRTYSRRGVCLTQPS